MIITAEVYFKGADRVEARARLSSREIVLKKKLSNESLYAEVNHSRWLVNCTYCNNAEFAWIDNLFFCTLCGNQGLGGEVYAVIMPKYRKAIERVLGIRELANRNWRYPETLNKLKKENVEHGLEVN